MKRNTTDSDRKKIIQNYYSVRSKDYDRQKSRTWKSEKGFGPEVSDELLKALEKLESKLLLEIGIGTGRNAKPVLEKINLHIVGLDLTKEMLKAARNKMIHYKQCLDLILGDAEHLPFQKAAFDGILCMSTMHYFENQEEVLKRAVQVLKTGGIFVYGDLSPHESDNQQFFEELERTVSTAHSRYYKASEMKKLFEQQGFHVTKTRTSAYRKSYQSLIEDKANYFEINPEKLSGHVTSANVEAKKQYDLTDTDLRQLYTVIVAIKESGSES